MLRGAMPIAVVMQRHPPAHRWCDGSWSVAAVVPGTSGAGNRLLEEDGERQTWLMPGLRLELHRDEDDGYFENWAAPEPKVFVMWQMRDGLPQPMLASVSYGEGTRMLDSGDCTEGVPMPPEVHDWLSAYLQAYYQPKPRRGREHG
ncbi:DUF3305 domain-containing protein [Noviherbaspirillum aridicola]|uniref:DUF3305 domain-containing protein n=1 Tax=Noviherbaspirillum aridicola TaxID=2849687 RepID=A0ABQ4PZB6_9BURK|nr:DUF3305 domain-containing protein [Noviherbaspirillum aridicola]GIZ50243.1 hypothetical protein NCCP691_02570 [Noviherbaspirillum aridicola]